MTTYPRDENRPGQGHADLTEELERETGVRQGEGHDRTAGDKVEDATNEFAGKVKQKFGDMTDDERLQSEGTRQELEADANQTTDRDARR